MMEDGGEDRRLARDRLSSILDPDSSILNYLRYPNAYQNSR